MRFLLLFLFAGGAIAGDWLTVGGDPSHSGWQRHGHRVTLQTAREMKLLWKQRVAPGPLTSPLILGPTITHRGVRELIFVAAVDTLYAIDADFGKIFWTRHLPGPPARCRMAMPWIEPDADEDYSEPIADDDDNDDEPDQMRPLHVIASDGREYTVRASDGGDVKPPVAGKAGEDCGPHEVARRPATWVDGAGVRRTYTPTATALVGPNWTREFPQPGPPAVSHGIVYVFAGKRLHLLDTSTGKPLWVSNEEIPDADPELAVANGHVVLNGRDGTVYCFGIPIER